MKSPHVIVGNALSGMIAAKSLAARGEQVVLVNGSPNWGGHFSKVSIGELTYDPGMVLHEFTSFSATSIKEDIVDYQAYSRNDSGRFCHTIRDFVHTYQPTHTVENIQMFVDGQYLPDLIISNQLEVLPHLPHAEKISHELAQIVETEKLSVLHASRKHQDSSFLHTNFKKISIANHGLTFHNLLIEPFCKKLMNASTESIVAYYHRVPWLPLFYPETLISYMRGTPQALPPTIFSYPNQGLVSDIAAHLIHHLHQTSQVGFVSEFPTAIQSHADAAITLSFANQPSITTSNLAWSGGLGDLLKLLEKGYQAPLQDKASFALVFVSINSADILQDVTVVSVVDPDFICYRITNQSRCAKSKERLQRIVVEVNYDYFVSKTNESSSESIGVVIAEELVKLGMITTTNNVTINKVIVLKNALAMPNMANLMIFDSQYQQVRQILPDVSLLAAASGFSSSSFNHQVLQGLKLNYCWQGATNGLP